MSKAIEITCSQCGEVFRFVTPNHDEVEALRFMQALTGNRDFYEVVGYGPTPVSSCHNVPFHGRLLGYHTTNLVISRTSTVPNRPRLKTGKFDTSDIVDAKDLVEIGPDRADRQADPRTDEWSDSDPTPPVRRHPTDHPNVVRVRGRKGIV